MVMQIGATGRKIGTRDATMILICFRYVSAPANFALLGDKLWALRASPVTIKADLASRFRARG